MVSFASRRSAVLLTSDYEQLHNNPALPPQGYVFVPKGDIYVTRHCRELTTNASKTVYIVYDRQTSKKLGLHCPRDIFEFVCQKAAVTAKKRAETVAAKDARDFKRNRHLITKLFPLMPSKSREELLEHGFLKGSGRVGRAMKLDEEERIELAVYAHVRHRFTDYEAYLKGQRTTGNQSANLRMRARKRVRNQTNTIANSWRPEPNNAGKKPSRYPQRAVTVQVKTIRNPGYGRNLARTLAVNTRQTDGKAGMARGKTSMRVKAPKAASSGAVMRRATTKRRRKSA